MYKTKTLNKDLASFGRQAERACAWIENETVCTNAGIVGFWPIALCSDHSLAFDRKLAMTKTTTLRQSARVLGSDAYPGYCYIVLLGDATIKIGYSNTEATLAVRLHTLGTETGSCTVLRVLPGGFVAEAVLHDRFSEFRDWTGSERFRVCPEILEFAASTEPACVGSRSRVERALAFECPQCHASPGQLCEGNISQHAPRLSLVT